MFNFFLIKGDYKDDFLKGVGWNQERNPNNLPAGLVPGSDDEEDEDFEDCNENENEEDSIDELLSHLSIADDKNKKRREKQKAEVPLQIVESTEEIEIVEHEDYDDMKIDVICQHNVPDPRGGIKMRTRLCFRAIYLQVLMQRR